MAAVAVTADNVRLDDAEVVTDWAVIGGGAGIIAETDFFYQDAACIARKGGTSPRGFRLLDVRRDAFDQIWQVDTTGPTFVDETTDANSVAAADWQIFPTTEATTDYVAIGATEANGRFGRVIFDGLGGTAGVGGVVVWEYFNGSFVALSGVSDGTSGFTAAVADGQSLTYTIPTDWTLTTLNGVEAFYIRARITTVYSTNPVYDQGFIADTNLDNGAHTTVIFKNLCTTPGLLQTLVNDGLQLGIGSDGSNFFLFDIEGSDTYPPRASWQIVPIDPNVTAYRDETTGTPVLSQGAYFSTEYVQTGTSKERNQALDAVDVGAGLTLVGGDGGDTDGLWQDFIDFDEGTVANRFGYATSAEGIIFIVGQMVIGTASATVFQDTGSTLVFPDGLFAQGFSGITVDLQNATTDVDLIDSNFFGKGSATTEETRPVLTVTGTTGNFDTNNCVLDAFDAITLTSACTLLNTTVSSSLAMTQAGATFNGMIVSGATNADNTAFITADDLGLFSNCEFTFSDGHAIEITATGTYTFSNNSFTGYGADASSDAAIFNDSGGLVTINITNAGDTPTIRNGAGASTTINNAVTLNVTVLDSASVAIQNARVAIYEDPEGSGETQLMNELTDVNGLATESFNFSSDINVSVRVRGADLTPSFLAVNSTQTITSAGLDVTITLSEDPIFT